MVVVLAVTFMYSLADCRELWSRALHCDIAKVLYYLVSVALIYWLVFDDFALFHLVVLGCAEQ